jgi:hypothetical protein
MFNIHNHKRKFKSKIILRFHLILVRWQSLRKQPTTNACDDGGKINPYILWESKLAKPLWKSVWQILKKLKIDL